MPLSEVDIRQMEAWRPTVAAVRECILAWTVVSVDFVSLLRITHPFARACNPTEGEVEITAQMCHDALTHGRFIDFGDLPNAVIMHGGNRGGPLWNMRALGMPFHEPWLFYHTWDSKNAPGSGHTLADHEFHISRPGFAGPGAVSIYMVNPLYGDPLGNFEVCELQPTVINGIKSLLLADRGLFNQVEGPLPANKYNCTVSPAAIRFADHPMAKELNNFGTPHSAAAGNIGDPVMTALLILNTRNIDRQTIRVDDKLQRARAKNGKPPIPAYDRVFSAPYVTAVQARGQRRERGEDQGGSHASPIPHIRMGHPRTYASGRSIFIADTLVNVPPESRAAFKASRTHYTVRS